MQRPLEKNLLAYVVAASAGLLCAALPADAEVVYTPSNTPLVTDGAPVNLDLNNDGIVDFSLKVFSFTDTRGGTFLRYDRVSPGQAANEIFSVGSDGKVRAAALPENFQIGPKGQFQSDPKGINLFLSSNGVGRSNGEWQRVEYAYIGLKFLVNGAVHYGWARVKFDYPGDSYRGNIYGYAYETIANQPIITGKMKGNAAHGDPRADLEAGSLGLLAAGAPVIDASRNKIANQR